MRLAQLMFSLLINSFKRNKYDNLQIGDKLYSSTSASFAEILEIKDIGGLKHYIVSVEQNKTVFIKTLAPDGLLIGEFELTKK
jgi:hypothetical protein